MTHRSSSISDIVALFPQTAAEIKKRAELACQAAEKTVETILAIPSSDRTFDNTVRALDNAQATFSQTMSGAHIMELVHPERSVRDMAHEQVLVMSRFSIDTFLSPELYQAFQSYADTKASHEMLSPEQTYYLNDSLSDFRRAGLHLPSEKLTRVKKLQKEIDELSMAFSRNIATDKSALHATREDLVGTSDHFINSLEQTPEGKYILKCDYPTVSEVRQHCSVASTRTNLLKLFYNRAYPVNEQILQSVIAKRDELSKLLGYKSFAHYNLDNQMAKKPETALTFIKNLAANVEKKEKAEFDRLCSDLPPGVTLVNNKLSLSDLDYVQEYYKKKHFSLDDRKVAEYFPLEKTLQGVFDIYQKFLSLDFELLKLDGLWHNDVSIIKISRRETSQVEGYIFLDLYPRDNKYTHACSAPLISPTTSPHNPSISALIANFPKPTKDRPSLLKHSDVKTFFHEFGHAMHHLLGRTEMYGLAGYRTKTDFVEVPSQMFEEWMWDKEILKQISSHYKTQQPLPNALIDKMIELKKFSSGYFVQRQCFFALLALAYFEPGSDKSLNAISRTLYASTIKNINQDPDFHHYASFGHLMGYGAKYYGYMWSKVFALDLFETVKKHGLLDSAIGEKLIQTVLGKGGSVEPSELLTAFLGREPTQDAFLRDIGI